MPYETEQELYQQSKTYTIVVLKALGLKALFDKHHIRRFRTRRDKYRVLL